RDGRRRPVRGGVRRRRPHRGGELPHAQGPPDRRHPGRPHRPGSAGEPAQLGRQGPPRGPFPHPASPTTGRAGAEGGHRPRRRSGAQAMTPAGTPLVELSNRQRAVAYQTASLLLGYPDEGLLASLPVLRRGVEGLPDDVGMPLQRVCEHLAGGSPTALAADYVATFDLKRRCCPYLTYYVY